MLVDRAGGARGELLPAVDLDGHRLADALLDALAGRLDHAVLARPGRGRLVLEDVGAVALDLRARGDLPGLLVAHALLEDDLLAGGLRGHPAADLDRVLLDDGDLGVGLRGDLVLRRAPPGRRERSGRASRR